MISAVKCSGHITGLVPNLVDGGLTHLQYADDTVLFLANDERSIASMNFLLFYYEAMSGLKVNYQKSEIMVMGVEEEEQQ